MMLFNKRAVGNHYESLANKYLIGQGLALIERNFTTKFGEIDLIMQDNEAIVFVEVKYRKQNQFGYAEEFVTHSKRKKLIKTAFIWLNKKGYPAQLTCFRFDVVAINQTDNGINWIKNAITQD
ncbi:YraN family protein [Vibrio sp. TH_r3]|nr:YraN family protein [Vibrio sp. TH_r3]MDV7104518.1 YraN family protein [Vibrio sp. TH_r3]